MNKVTLAGLSQLGLSLNAEIEGKNVISAKKTNRQNVFQIEMADDKGQNKSTAFVGAKSIEEGLMVQEKEGGTIKIGPGFEIYTNKDSEVWVRNKNRANAKLTVL